MITYATPTAQPRTPGAWMLSVHLSPDGQRLIVACDDGQPKCPSNTTLSTTIWAVDGVRYQALTTERVFTDGGLVMLYGQRIEEQLKVDNCPPLVLPLRAV